LRKEKAFPLPTPTAVKLRNTCGEAGFYLPYEIGTVRAECCFFPLSNLRKTLPPLQGAGVGMGHPAPITPIPLLASPLKGEGRWCELYGSQEKQQLPLTAPDT